MAGAQPEHHEFIVVGAGPGGVQTAYSMAKEQRDFIVLERAGAAGAFMSQFPRFRRLISINKKYTGESDPDYNLRHDWNSLLSNERRPLFTDYTDQYWPHADLIPQYLADYVTEHKLDRHFRFSTDVVEIRREGGGSNDDRFVISTDSAGRNTTFTCDVLVMATGRPGHATLPWNGAEHFETYDTMSTDLSKYRNKKVLIVGGGNSAFEVADGLSSSAAFVHVYARSLRFAYQTHYVGDLRALNLEMLDRYMLKSQDALILRPQDNHASIVGPEALNWTKRADGSLEFSGDPQLQRLPLRRRTYDYVISCVGRLPEVSFFHESIRPKLSKSGRWVRLTTAYESVNVKNLFFTGNLGHYRDYRQSSGGFIHGFRYVAKALPHVIALRRNGWDQAPWPSSTMHCDIAGLTDILFKRISTASSMYQMFKYFGDVVLLTGASVEQCSLKYFRDVPQELLRSGVLTFFSGVQDVTFLTLTMEYNPFFHGEGSLHHKRAAHSHPAPVDIAEEDIRFANTFGGPYGNNTAVPSLPEEVGNDQPADRPWHWRAAAAPQEGEVSNFIHPVLRIWIRRAGTQLPVMIASHHVQEDLQTLWELEDAYVKPAREFLRSHASLWGMGDSCVGTRCEEQATTNIRV